MSIVARCIDRLNHHLSEDLDKIFWTQKKFFMTLKYLKCYKDQQRSKEEGIF